MTYRFREAREKAGLSTLEVAKRIGVSQPAVTYWDNGTKPPSIETLCKLADLYSCSFVSPPKTNKLYLTCQFQGSVNKIGIYRFIFHSILYTHALSFLSPISIMKKKPIHAIIITMLLIKF